MGVILGLAIASNLHAHEGSGTRGGQGSGTRHGGQGSGTRHSAPAARPMIQRRPGANSAPTQTDTAAPHGGQMTAGPWYSFEVVYTPKETRIFVYSPPGRPLDVRNVRGEAIMEVRGHPQLFRYPVRVSANPMGQSYLSLPVNVSRVRDGDMRVTFELTGLPRTEKPNARFTQMFALTRAAPTVQVATLTGADRPLIERQRVCPVTGSRLGEHGPPIKLLVGSQPLYVCCRGCIDKVAKAPDFYLQKALASARERARAPSRLPGAQGVASRSAAIDHGHHRPPRITVAKATADDEAAIRAQGFCPVTGEPLGSMGPPVKVVVEGREVFLCCGGCEDTIKEDPAKYLAKLPR